MKKAILILITCLLVLLQNISVAQSPGDYRSRQTGAWSTAASWQTYDGTNWINAIAAPSSSNGIITILSGHVVTSSGTLTVDQIVVNTGGTLSITGGTFTVRDTAGTDLDCNGTLALSNATLNGAGTVNLNAGSTFNWISGYNGGSGIMNISQGAVMIVAGPGVAMADTKTLNNAGTWNWTSGTFYYNNGTPVVNNSGTLNISTDDDVTRLAVNTGTFNNLPAGVINKIGSPSDETSFNNISSFTNAGRINVNSSTLKLNINSVHTGTINVAFGANMNFSAGVSLFNAGTVLSGTGNMNFEGGTDTLYAATVSVNNINVSGAQVSVAPAITMGSGSMLSLSGGALVGAGTVTLGPGSIFNWSGGFNGGSGIMNISAGAVCNMINGVNFSDTKTINNAGTWNWTSGTFVYYNGSPVFNNSGTFNINTDADLVRSGVTTGTFNNLQAGVINKTGSPDGETSFNNISAFTNAGTINVNSSRFRLNINSVHTGTINMALGANTNFSAGIALFNTGTVLAGAGSLNFDGGNDTINAAAVSISNVSVSNGVVYVVPAISIGSGGTLSLSNGSLVGPGTITLNPGSTFNWSGGFNGGSGVMNISAGAVCNMTSGVNFSDTKTINNAGTWNWTSGAFYYYNSSPVFNNSGTFNINTDADLVRSNLTTGTFNNLATGIINKTGSPDGETSFNNISAFSNAGRVNVNSSILRLNINSVHTGTINVLTGANMSFSSGIALFNSGTVLSGTGNLNFDAGNDTLYAASVSVRNINISGATVSFAPDITVSSGSTLNLSGGTLTGLGTITFGPGSTFNWSGGFNGGSGVMNISGGAVCNMTSGVNFSDTKTINNAGTWNWMSGQFIYYNGSPVFNNSGTFNISTDADLTRNSTNTGVFNNLLQGVINKTGSPSDETSFNNISAFNNAGTVNIKSSSLQLNVAGTHAGTYKVAYGAQLGGSLNMSFTGSALSNDGSITLAGLSLNGSAAQSLSGEGSINTLTVSNANGITLGGTQTINTALNITNGKITIGDANLIVGTAATCTGGSATAYIVTNGQGSFQRRVLNNNTNTLFPVGFATTFMPVNIQLTTASVADNFAVRLLPSIYGGYDTTNGNAVGGGINANSVNTSWFISESVPGSSTATITFQWQAANEASGFNRATSRFGQYRSGAWSLDAATVAASGANPYSLTRSALTSFSVFGITNQFVTSMNNYVGFCSGNAINIPYNAIGTFSAGNVFTAQLSDSTGSYATPVSIGSVASATSGSINATIPGSTLRGTGYRIRIVSSTPAMVSPDNPSIIPIRTCAATPPVLTKNIPSKVNVSDITVSGATVSWDKIPTASGYDIQFKEASALVWNAVRITTENLSMDMLQPNTPYEVKVRSISGTDYSDFSDAQHFTTLSVRTTESATEQAAGRLFVYPNPTSGQFMLKLRVKEIQTGNALMRIINTAGQVVHMESIAVADYELKKTISFHPSNSSSGVYFITVQAGNKMYYSKINYRK